MAGLPTYEQLGLFYLGQAADGSDAGPPVLYASQDLVTHAVCVGMTGSGKTGLGIVLLEEAALDGIPALAIDPKGDLANLALTFPALRPEDFEPWIDPEEAAREGRSVAEHAAAIAGLWRRGLSASGQDGARIARLRDAAHVDVYTPGLAAGRPLSVLDSLKAPGEAVAADPDALRERISAAVSGILALLGIDADPLRSREHILLSLLVDGIWKRGRAVDLAELIRSLQRPPFEKVGVLDLESFFPAADRAALATSLNNLLASPGFAAWLSGEPLDVGRLLFGDDGRPRIAVLSIAHLADSERMFFVTLLLNEIVAWMRAQPGTSSLRALLYMDEVFGYLPPTANPPSKRPLLTLLKQARAFGIGTVLATQNPVDLDYKALSNAGTWLLGRLQTERDKARLRDGLMAADAGARVDAAALDATLSGLGKRRFLLHNVHDDAPVVFESRFALSYLRGPLSRDQLRRLARASAPEAGPPPAAREPQPAAPEAPGAMGGGPEAPRAAERPVVEGGIEEVFLPVESGAGSGMASATATYAPGLLVEATLHYTQRGTELDAWDRVHLWVPLRPGARGPVWSEARELAAPPTLAGQPEPGARFAPLPGAAGRLRSYAGWARRAREHLYRHRPRVLYRCDSPRLVSGPDEELAAFRARVRERHREERDLEREKLGARYAPRVARVRERIQAAEARLQRESEQAKDATVQAAVSIGTSVLSAVLGRRLASVTNASRARSAARSAGHAARQRGDVDRARERIRQEQERLSALEQEFAEQLEAVRARFGEEPATREISVAPRKGDLAVDSLRLAWAPTAGPGAGAETPGGADLR